MTTGIIRHNDQTRAIILGVVLGCILGALVLLAAWTAHTAHDSCGRVNHISLTIVATAERALKTLGKPGGSAYAYYQAHPAELALARQQLRAEVTAFAPQKCSFFS